MMSLVEYWDKLRAHDWHYHMSDDGRAYRAGKENEARLEATSRSSTAHGELWKGFAKRRAWVMRPEGQQDPGLPPRPEESC